MSRASCLPVLQDDPLGKIRRVELTPPADTRPVFVVRKLLGTVGFQFSGTEMQKAPYIRRGHDIRANRGKHLLSLIRACKEQPSDIIMISSDHIRSTFSKSQWTPSGLADDLLRPMLLAKEEEEEQWGFSTAEAAALAIDEVAQLRRTSAGTVPRRWAETLCSVTIICIQ